MALFDGLLARGLNHPLAMLLTNTFGPPVPVASGGTGADTAQGATQNLGTWYVLAASGAQVSHTGTTAETTLATITVPANSLGANGALRVYAIWTNNNSGNSKTFRVRFSGAAGTQFRSRSMTTNLTTPEYVLIQNRNATNSQVGGDVTGAAAGWASGTGAVITAAVDTTAATTLVLTGQLANSGDTINLEQYVVEVMKRT